MLPRQRSALGFSSFARSLARVHSSRTRKHKRHPSASKRSPNPSSKHQGGVISNHIPRKKPKHSESSDEEDEGIVQVDFAFFDPKPEDFHGVKILLQTFLDNHEWDLSSFVDLILGQTRVGTVVKVEDDEDEGLFSLVSAINLGHHMDKQCILELKEFVHKVCDEVDIKHHLNLLLGAEAKSVGLLVSQRVVNLPSQLLPPLYDALFDEILWATEDEPTEELQKSFQFKFYLLITRIYQQKNADLLKEAGDESILYIKPEDEIFHKLSLWTFTFPLCTQQVAPRELRNYKLMGMVMLVNEDTIPTFREELKSLVQG